MSFSQVLLARDLITEDQADEAEKHRKTHGGSFIRSLVSLGFMTREDLDLVLGEIPPTPHRVEETGLDPQFLLNLILKSMYVTGMETKIEIADYVKLSPFVVDHVLQDGRQKRLFEILGTVVDNSHFRYALSELGRRWASDALQHSQYTGPAPVPLAAYHVQVTKQLIGSDPVTGADLHRCFAHLVLPEDLRRRLGPAINSAKSILLYGASGNGKTSVAEAIGDAFQGTIFIPYCIEVDGQIITVFDPSVHREVRYGANGNGQEPESDALADDVMADPRWVCCRRPVVITGGELTMEMFDLSYDSVSRYYEAPASNKATGGVFIIDDFGRQRVPAGDILNRWILPLERGFDYLTLRNGKKLRMPFDQLVIFSTNFKPEDLMDEAALRRIQYKFHLPPPTPEAYEDIFRRVCEAHALELPEELLDYLMGVFYPETGAAPSAYHPRFIVEHVIASCDFEKVPMRLTHELARDALKNLVVTELPDF
jgi:predicted ATPase with chaperone activity